MYGVRKAILDQGCFMANVASVLLVAAFLGSVNLPQGIKTDQSLVNLKPPFANE